jgi:hypothetical protein
MLDFNGLVVDAEPEAQEVEIGTVLDLDVIRPKFKDYAIAAFGGLEPYQKSAVKPPALAVGSSHELDENWIKENTHE